MGAQEPPRGRLIDRDYVIDVLSRLMREPTQVPIGRDTVLDCVPLAQLVNEAEVVARLVLDTLG